jgi:triacylglycerol lipase
MTASSPHPIVLAQGFARFDVLREVLIDKFNVPETGLGDNWHYFRNVKTHLEAHGFRVYHTDVAFADRVDIRAQQLGDQINQIMRETGSGKVHIIAHSMGGLDARHLIVDIPGMADRVASLTTIGTPHFGTRLADDALRWGVGGLIRAVSPLVRFEGAEDLTTGAVAQFNALAADLEVKNSVVYQTYSSFESRALTFSPLQNTWLLLQLREGANDGLVSVKSQAWSGSLTASDGTTKAIRQKQFPFPADHLNECGWWDPNELLGGTDPLEIDQQIAEYENKVKGVYLEIAQSVANL